MIMNKEQPALHRELKNSFDYTMQNYHKKTQVKHLRKNIG